MAPIDTIDPCLGALIVLGLPFLIMYILAGRVNANTTTGDYRGKDTPTSYGWRFVMVIAGALAFFLIGYIMYIGVP